MPSDAILKTLLEKYPVAKANHARIEQLQSEYSHLSIIPHLEKKYEAEGKLFLPYKLAGLIGNPRPSLVISSAECLDKIEGLLKSRSEIFNTLVAYKDENSVHVWTKALATYHNVKYDLRGKLDSSAIRIKMNYCGNELDLYIKT